MCNGTKPKRSTASVDDQARSSFGEMPPAPSEDDELKWRRDPEETFSDWTIEVVSKTAGSKENNVGEGSNSNGAIRNNDDKDEIAFVLLDNFQTYHVHKCVLADGSRKSEYFVRLFKSATQGLFHESNTCSSRIELEPLAASTFPAFLDYIYAPNRPLEITTNSATALYFLGEYFGNHRLCWDAKEFFLQDLSLENMDTYYEHATVFKNERILSSVAEFMGKHLMSICPSSPIVEKAEPAFWLETLRVAKKAESYNNAKEYEALQSVSDKAFSRHWSTLISEIGRLHIEAIDTSLFDELANEYNMPHIDESVALNLCMVDDTLHEGDGDESQELYEFETQTLQERCGVAMAKTWESFEIKEDTLPMLEERKPLFLATILVESIREAQLNSVSQNEQIMNMKQQLSSSQYKERKLQHNLQQLNQTFTDYKTKALSTLQARDEEIERMQEILEAKANEMESKKQQLMVLQETAERKISTLKGQLEMTSDSLSSSLRKQADCETTLAQKTKILNKFTLMTGSSPLEKSRAASVVKVLQNKFPELKNEFPELTDSKTKKFIYKCRYPLFYFRA